MNGLPPTPRQWDFVRDLQRRLRLTDAALDIYATRTFGVPLAWLDRSQISTLLDEMQGWTTVPADLQRALGQLDLFGGAA